MSGIEQFPVFGYDAEKGEVFKKKKEKPNNEVKKYPAFKYNQQTGEIKEVRAEKPKMKKAPKNTKLRLVGALLATLSAGTAGYEGLNVAADYKPAEGEKKTTQPNTIQPPQAPFDYYEEKNREAPAAESTAEKPASNKIDTTKKKIENIFHNEARSFDQMFDYHHEGKFNNADRMEDELVRYWEGWYKKNPDRLQGLLNGHYEYTAWEPHIEQRLKEKNIGDTELRSLIKYIALTETDFTNKKPSKANAVGPYQIMKTTGMSEPSNMIINKIIDQRRDPLEGAEGAAKIIEDNRERLGEKNRPIKMARYVYNGAFAWHALAQAKAEKARFDTKYFMHFVENDINIIKEIAHESRWDIYRTKRNETLDEIFVRFQKAGKITNEAEFYCLNRSINRNKKLKAGAKITLPLKVGMNRPEKAREGFYNKMISGRGENAGYGARMEAIEKIIQESGALKIKKEPIKFREIMTTAKTAVPVSKIIKRYGLSHKQFKEINEKIVGNIVPPDTKIRLPQA